MFKNNKVKKNKSESFKPEIKENKEDIDILEASEEIMSEEDYENINEEGVSGYKTGGYHRVHIGDVYNNRYIVEKKLGWGHFSTVWLATDTKAKIDDINKYVALKIQKSAKHYTEAAVDEIEMLECIAKTNKNHIGYKSLLNILDSFTIIGKNGVHICMVFNLLGENLLSWIVKYNYHGLPIALVKRIAKQVLEGLDYLHTCCHLIHTDLKPENIMLTRRFPVNIDKIHKGKGEIYYSIQKILSLLSGSQIGMKLSKNQKKKLKFKLKKLKKQQEEEQKVKNMFDNNNDISQPDSIEHVEGQLEEIIDLNDINSVIVDLGNACWIQKHFTDDITTRQYRSPEAIVGAPYSTGVDIFSLGCFLFELITGEYLFEPKDGLHKRVPYSRDDDHLALMIELMGKMPKFITSGGKYSREFFNKEGELLKIHHLEFWGLKDVFHEKYSIPLEEAKILTSFLEPMLNLNPLQRATAKECLKHGWLQPDNNKILINTITKEIKILPENSNSKTFFQKTKHKSQSNNTGDLEISEIDFV